MGLVRVLNPELVLCSSCRGRDENESRWRAYANGRNGAVLVRDVCAAQACPALQVRGHLCGDHVMEAEIAWQRHFPLRTCNFCCRDVMQLYSAKQEVWFICPANESTEQARGAVKVATLQPRGHRQRPKPRAKARAKAQRKARANRLGEQLLALDWSIGNIPIAPMFLWKENRRRLDAEAQRQLADDDDKDDKDTEDERTARGSKHKPPVASRYVYADPTDVFCVVDGCQHYAKTGNSCRFHTTRPVTSFRIESSTPQSAVAVATAVPTAATTTCP